MTAPFNDRRAPLNQPGHPEAINSRLAADKVRLKSVAEGHHKVVHNGEEKGEVFTYPPTGDPGVGRYAVAGSGDIGFHNRSTAARFAVAAHDVQQHRLGGFTEAHHAFIHGNTPVKASRQRR